MIAIPHQLHAQRCRRKLRCYLEADFIIPASAMSLQRTRSGKTATVNIPIIHVAGAVDGDAVVQVLCSEIGDSAIDVHSKGVDRAGGEVGDGLLEIHKLLSGLLAWYYGDFVGAALGVSVGVEAISKVTVAGYEEPGGLFGCGFKVAV